MNHYRYPSGPPGTPVGAPAADPALGSLFQPQVSAAYFQTLLFNVQVRVFVFVPETPESESSLQKTSKYYLNYRILVQKMFLRPVQEPPVLHLHPCTFFAETPRAASGIRGEILGRIGSYLLPSEINLFWSISPSAPTCTGHSVGELPGDEHGGLDLRSGERPLVDAEDV